MISLFDENNLRQRQLQDKVDAPTVLQTQHENSLTVLQCQLDVENIQRGEAIGAFEALELQH